MSDFDPNYIPKKSFSLIGQKAIVLNKGNKILVLQRSKKSGAGGKWALPGGALEFNEDPYKAIKREIEEETQLEVIDIKPFHLRSYVTDDKDFVLIIGYQCKAGSENVILNWEHDNFKWLPKEEAVALELTEDGRYFLEHFNSGVI